MTDYYVELSFEDVCRDLHISREIFIDIVDYGIVQPKGSTTANWKFDTAMVSQIKRAIRLHRELDLAWQDVAIVGRLLDERNHLLLENERLRQRLERFLLD